MMNLSSILDLNMISQKHYFNQRIKFKICSVTYVNGQVKKERRIAKKLQNQITFTPFYIML
jgi:hypothetical protein